MGSSRWITGRIRVRGRGKGAIEERDVERLFERPGEVVMRRKCSTCLEV